MPVHDWSRVAAGIFHHLHHSWIEEIQRALNAGLLPDDYYALAEQRTAGYGPDVLTLQVDSDDNTKSDAPNHRNGGLMVAKPQVALTAETDMEFYRRKQNVVAVRHVSDDRVVALVEVVSPGNKSSRAALRSFVEKTAQLLDQRIHLLILDLHRPGNFDPQGIHGAIWEEIAEAWVASPDRPLTLVAYESALTVRAFVQPLAIGDALIDMPLYLEPDGYVLVPLEITYDRAFAALPKRWRSVVEA
ncbi:MAG: DUF4058 family protein [Pirellulaceae bacterium]|jgi:hypothetical protein|nr:DUF4058 family protein [Pirellulaceae bacterium]